LLLEYVAAFRMTEAVGSPVITDAMVHTLRMLVLAKWYLLFISMFLCTIVLAPAAKVLRFGTRLLAGSAVAGAVVLAYDDRLLAGVILVMFIGLCAVSALLAFRPEEFCSFSESEVAPANETRTAQNRKESWATSLPDGYRRGADASSIP
jgi:hypothetical protein